MSIACPHCKAGLTPKELKPGRYQPKCPRCSTSFILQVQWIVTTADQALPVERPTEPTPSKTIAPPPPRKMDPEERAARLLAGENVDAATEHDPNATGDFTEPDSASLPHALLGGKDANATGDFSEAASKPAAPSKESPKPAASRPVSKPSRPETDTNKTTIRPALVTSDNDTDKTALQPPLSAGNDPVTPTSPPRVPDRPSGATGRPPSRVTRHEQTVVRPSLNATGDYTEDTPKASPVAVARSADATGDFTEATSDPQSTSASASADQDFSVGEPSSAKPTKTPRTPAVTETEQDDDAPPRLGGYEVLKVLGKGGMGAVLLGRQVSLDRKVAIKVMHPRIAQNPTFVARFTREAYAAAQLTHHNVIQIYDIGEDHGQHFFSMEFVIGKSLGDMLKKDGKMAPEVAVGYVLQAARGLKYGHVQGMVHRDIKPDNLMLNDQGIVKVADLGLVKLPGGELPQQAGAVPSSEDGEPGSAELTRAGAVMGTPAYMPPEQGRDSGSVDQRADIYSLGCTLYVLLTGRPPFEGKTAIEVISKHQTEAIVPPEVVVKRVPKTLSAILLKMMAKKPEDRQQSMEEVIAALEGFLGVDRSGPFHPTEAQADDLEKATCQFNVRSKGKRKTALAAAFFAGCALGVVGAAVAGMAALADGLVGLMLMTPAAYFVIHGTLTGSVVFTRTRAVVFGMRFFDWVMGIGGLALSLATLFLFGLLWAWLGFALLAVGLGYLLWFLTDRVQAKGQEPPISDARALFRTMRLQGVEEEAVQQFACKFSGAKWEPFFEALFGYEAKLAARAYRKGKTGEESPMAGTWREPVIVWLEARLEARRLTVERKHLKKVEAKALEAEGVSRADANAQAEAMAEELVGQATVAKQARKEGKEVNVRSLVAAARERRRPKPGYNIAGVKLRNLWLKDFLNDWFGRRLRLGVGAIVFAAGLLWMSQNNLLSQNSNVVKQVVAFEFEAAGKSLDAAAGKPLVVSFLPDILTDAVHSYAVPITGFLLLVSGLLHFGWRPSLVAVPGAAIAILGPSLGVPEVGPLSPTMLSLLVGGVLILVVGRFVRK